MKTEDNQDKPETAAASADDIKRRFREALDRKQSQHQDGVGGEGRGGSKIHGTHGPASNKRSFRRKSGG
ncbi:DUF5302 domain-containing protein [Nocardia sp. NPDC050406]|uniref:DUF5302 domain-containing protein n=1 Tax=Nocardia sp. NPDC050406 TaxID=3364318 RepID=UPI003793B17F